MRYHGEHLQITREFPTLAIRDAMEVILPTEPADDPRQWIGRPLPELEVEAEAGKTAVLRLERPALLYVAPAWPRPMVTGRAEFADLQALKRLDSARVRVLGTGATAAELRDLWKERGLDAPPLALHPASAQRLGAKHLPLALVVDRAGQVVWVKEGYAPGDEAEWQRQIERAGG